MSKTSREEILQAAQDLLDELELENEDSGCPVCKQHIGFQTHALNCKLFKLETILAEERKNYDGS